MKRTFVLGLAAAGCGAHSPPPMKAEPVTPVAVVAPVEDAMGSSGALDETETPSTPLVLDVRALYTISIDRVPATCQEWQRDDETDEYRWSRKEGRLVHMQRLGLRGVALTVTDERHDPDGSIRANTCQLIYRERVGDEITLLPGALFLTKDACTRALAKQERVAFRPVCNAALADEELEAMRSKFTTIASSHGTMYAHVFPDLDDPAGQCETVRLAGRPADADGWVVGTATHPMRKNGKRITETHHYRFSFADEIAMTGLPGGADEQNHPLIFERDHIQTFENLYFTLAACRVEVERSRWEDGY